jgi:hypothetical protein
MRLNLLYIALLWGIPLTVFGQEGQKQEQNQNSADEIARELSNPVSATASLVFQGTYNGWTGSLEGVNDQHSSSFVFLPTLPFKLGKYNLTVRPSFPLAAAPYITDEGSWDIKRGFGDIVLLGLLGTATEGGFLYGAGPTAIFPTASDPSLGGQQWQVGPAALAGILKKWGVVGLLWQHWWGFGAEEGVDAKNVGTLQLFYWFSAGSGWQVGGSPIATSNYVAGSDASFVVPLNLGVAKTFILGRTPVKATLQGQYFVTRPDVLGQSWGIFFQIVPVIKVPW